MRKKISLQYHFVYFMTAWNVQP